MDEGHAAAEFTGGTPPTGPPSATTASGARTWTAAARVTNTVDTLATALYAATDVMLKERPDLVPWCPPVGITPRLSDAELVTLASMQAILGYYLQPSGQVAAKPYKLLRQALSRSAKVAVAKSAGSGRERLGLLRVRDDVIVLHAMRWPDEIRDPTELLPPPVELSDDEIDGALALMDTMTREDLEGEEFRDTYTEAVQEIIEAKREHRELPAAPEPAEPDRVVDLMAALQESVQKAKASRGEDAEVHDLPKAKKAAKKTTAKKQPTARTRSATKTSSRNPRRSA